MSVLAVHNLQKSFRSGERRLDILTGVNLHVAPGESVSLRGASGSGKTTLLNLIARLEDPDAGEVRWGEHDVTKTRSAELASLRTRHLGMVFQSYYLVPELNALENVMLGGRIGGLSSKEAEKRARELLERVGLSERLHHIPPQLSGGERQRVAVARALINQPAIILADEPTGNLDEVTAQVIMDLLLAVCTERQTALLLVTHSRDFARRTQRQYHLHGGVLSEGE